MPRSLTLLIAAAALCIAGVACSAPKADSNEWLLGTWQKTADEDAGPPDSMTFREDGRFVTYGASCEEHSNSYFVHDGNVFLFIPMKKGPVALVLQPSNDKESLTFTSPRTLNNAVYEPREKPHCRGGS